MNAKMAQMVVRKTLHIVLIQVVLINAIAGADMQEKIGTPVLVCVLFSYFDLHTILVMPFPAYSRAHFFCKAI